MIFIKRALEYLRKKISKTILLTIIFVVIANFIIAGLLIQNASENAQNNTRLEIGADITYDLNYDQLFADYEKGLLKREEIAALKTGGLLQLDSVQNGGGPTVSNFMSVVDSDYVSQYHFSISTNIDADIDAYQLESNVQTSTTFKLEGFAGLAPLSDSNGGIELIEGRYPTEDEVNSASPVLIISQDIAKINNLSIGDSIDVDFVQVDDSNKTDFTIIGIFNPLEINNQVNDVTNLIQNRIYAPYTVFDNIGMEEGLFDQTVVNNTLIKLSDPENLDAFRSEIQGDIEFSYGIISANDALYNSLVGPIESIGLITKIFVVSIIVTGGFIIGLITALTINDRKNEIGILLAVGESKLKIIAQFVLEVVIIAVLSFTLSLFTGEMLGENMSNTLLDSEVFGAVEDQSEIVSKSVRPGKGSNVKNLDLTNVKDAAELSIGLDLTTILQIFGIGLVLTVVSTSIPTIYVMRFSPKQILSNRVS